MKRLIALLCALGPTGCQSPNPRGDYDLAAAHIARTTGRTEVYRPDDEAACAALAGELLADGLTADDAAAVALLNNPSLQARIMDVGIARAAVVQSGLLSNPSLFASLRLPAGGGLANVEASLAQNIADLWLIPARRRAAEQALDAAILALAREAGLLAAEARAAYYGAAAADRLLEIARENVDIARQSLDVTLARQTAGAGTAVEVNLSRAELLETELSLSRAALAAFAARQRLATLLGLDAPPEQLALAEPLPDPPDRDPADEELVEWAAANRLDLRAADRLVDAAQARWEQELRSVFSDVSVGVALERAQRPQSEGQRLLARSITNSVESGEVMPPRLQRRADQDTDFIIGPSVNLALPIFDQNQAQIARAHLAWRQAERLRRALVIQVAQDARLAGRRAGTTWQIARFYRDQLLSLREDNLELARSGYRAGRTAFVIVLEAQRALLTVRANYAQALADAALAAIGLEQVIGRPTREILNDLATVPPAATRPAGEGEDP